MPFYEDYSEDLPEWMKHVCVDEYADGYDEIDWDSMSFEEIEAFEEEHGETLYFGEEADYVNHMVETHGYIPTGSFDGYYD